MKSTLNKHVNWLIDWLDRGSLHLIMTCWTINIWYVQCTLYYYNMYNKQANVRWVIICRANDRACNTAGGFNLVCRPITTTIDLWSTFHVKVSSHYGHLPLYGYFHYVYFLFLSWQLVSWATQTNPVRATCIVLFVKQCNIRYLTRDIIAY